MKIEDIDLLYKKDLLEFINFYISKLEEIMRNLKGFEYLNLDIIEELFDQFQDYVSKELEIIPRVDDDNFNYEDYY